MQTEKQSINGVEYFLSSYIDYKNVETPYSKDFQLENKISFHGMDRVIEKVIYKSDFEKKVDFKNVEKFNIESVTFTVNSNKDKIDLRYLINLGDYNKTVILTLQKDGEMWNLK